MAAKRFCQESQFKYVLHPCFSALAEYRLTVQQKRQNNALAMIHHQNSLLTKSFYGYRRQVQLGLRWRSLSKYMLEIRSERALVSYFAQWRAKFQQEVHYRETYTSFNTNLLKKRLLRFLRRHVKREQRIRYKSNELNRKKERRTLTLALISLRSYSQYSIAKKQAVK